jgi:chromosomal replication initiator protein
VSQPALPHAAIIAATRAIAERSQLRGAGHNGAPARAAEVERWASTWEPAAVAPAATRLFAENERGRTVGRQAGPESAQGGLGESGFADAVSAHGAGVNDWDAAAYPAGRSAPDGGAIADVPAGDHVSDYGDDTGERHTPPGAFAPGDRFDARAAWQKLLGEMQMQLPSAAYYTWLHDTWVEAYEDGDFIIGTANTYARDWLTNRLRNLVRKSLKEICGRMVDVQFVVRPRRVQDGPNAQPAPLYSQSAEGDVTAAYAGYPVQPAPSVQPSFLPDRRPRPAGLESRLNPTHTFESFVVGNNNRFACAAAQAIAEKPGYKFNPLFVYGGVGLGKTHLLHAIGNALQQQGYAVLYCTSEQFTNDLISSIRLQNTEAFRNKYRELDALLIDDIQFIAGKESTQEEFFHTFNHLQASGKQVVLSSDRPPRALQSLEERLRSRFEGGIQVDVSAPDFETRVAILQSKAIRHGISVPLDVLKLVAERVDSNIRELEGALNHLFLQAQMVQTTLDMQLAEHTLNHVSPQRKPCSPPRLIALVAEAHKLTVDDLVGPRRTRPIADARHVAMFLLREELSLSLPQIGQLFGGRDHTTVSHALEKIGAELRQNEILRRDMALLREQIYTPFQG